MIPNIKSYVSHTFSSSCSLITMIVQFYFVSLNPDCDDRNEVWLPCRALFFVPCHYCIHLGEVFVRVSLRNSQRVVGLKVLSYF